jgi:hypothetical protein
VTEYTKVKRDDVVYYIQTQCLEAVINHLLLWPTSDLALLQHADFAIDVVTDEIKKKRFLLEEVFDNFTGVKP